MTEVSPFDRNAYNEALSEYMGSVGNVADLKDFEKETAERQEFNERLGEIGGAFAAPLIEHGVGGTIENLSHFAGKAVKRAGTEIGAAGRKAMLDYIERTTGTRPESLAAGDLAKALATKVGEKLPINLDDIQAQALRARSGIRTAVSGNAVSTSILEREAEKQGLTIPPPETPQQRIARAERKRAELLKRQRERLPEAQKKIDGTKTIDANGEEFDPARLDMSNPDDPQFFDGDNPKRFNDNTIIRARDGNGRPFDPRKVDVSSYDNPTAVEEDEFPLKSYDEAVQGEGASFASAKPSDVAEQVSIPPKSYESPSQTQNYKDAQRRLVDTDPTLAPELPGVANVESLVNEQVDSATQAGQQRLENALLSAKTEIPDINLSETGLPKAVSRNIASAAEGEGTEVAPTALLHPSPATDTLTERLNENIDKAVEGKLEDVRSATKAVSKGAGIGEDVLETLGKAATTDAELGGPENPLGDVIGGLVGVGTLLGSLFGQEKMPTPTYKQAINPSAIYGL